MSCASATSPISSTTGSVAGGCRAERAGDDAVDAVGAAVAQHARAGRRGTGQNVSMSRTGIEEATNSVAWRGSSTPSSARDCRLGQPVAGRARRAIASAARSSALRQLASQSAVFGASACGAAASCGERTGRLDRERVATAPTPGPARRPRGRARPGARRPGRPATVRSGFDTGRSPTRSTRSGVDRGGEPRSRSSAS